MSDHISTRDINQWPYSGNDGMESNYRANNGLWVETIEKTFYDQLGCVPPRLWKGNAFMVGECYSGNDYAVFVDVDGRFFGKICGILSFNPTKYTEQIRYQFGIE